MHPFDLQVTSSLRKIFEQNLDMLTIEEVKEILAAIASNMETYEAETKIDYVAALTELYASFDDLAKSFIKKMGIITCKKGCSFCCHYNVDINEHEAAILYDAGKKAGIEFDKEYLTKQAPLKDGERPISEVSACVFLKNGECSVYDVRPLNCRKYFAHTEPELCNAVKYPDGQVGVCADINMEIAVSGICNVQGVKRGMMAELLLDQIEKHAI